MLKEMMTRSAARPFSLDMLVSTAMIQPSWKYYHASWYWLVIHLSPTVAWPLLLCHVLRLVHYYDSTRIYELDLACAFRRLDIVDAAPEAVGVHMGAVAVARRIDDGPHRRDFEDLVLRVAQLLRYPAQCRVDLRQERFVVRVLVQVCGAVPAAELGRIRLVDTDLVPLPLSVSQIEKSLVERLTIFDVVLIRSSSENSLSARTSRNQLFQFPVP